MSARSAREVSSADGPPNSRSHRLRRCSATSGQLTIQGRSPDSWKTSRMTLCVSAISPGSTIVRNSSCDAAFAMSRFEYAIEHHRAERLVSIEDELEYAADVAHVLGVERRLAVDARVAAGLEKPIAVAKRNVQRLREDQHGLTARLRSSRFDEADMSSREARSHRQIELADAACRSPLAQQVTDRRADLSGLSRPYRRIHAVIATRARWLPPLPVR